MVSCEKGITRQIEVLPHEEIAEGGGYSIDFESGTEGWYADTLSVNVRPVDNNLIVEMGKPQVIIVTPRVNSWRWSEVQPNSAYITSVAGGSRAWFTIDTVRAENGEITLKHGYEREEQSWVYTPSFDISNLQRPTVQFDLIYDFDNRDNGAVFQYSTDDGRTWNILGGDGPNNLFDTGLEWYTHDDIDGNPGGQRTRRIGWAESSSGGAGNWVFARHRLEVIPDNIVRFRFAVGAAEQSIEREGMGIDNFWIGNRTRISMIEEFSTEIDASARILHQTIGQYLEGRDGGTNGGNINPYASGDEIDALRITYYGFPRDNPNNQADRLYQVNPEDVNARQLYYGVLNIPTTILEGDFGRNDNDQGNSAVPPWTLNELNKSALERPEVNISFKELTANEEGIKITVETALTQFGIDEGISGDYRLHIAIIERDVDMLDSPNGQAKFNDVLRKLLPSAAGTLVTFDASDANANASQEVSVTWQIFSTYLSETDPDELQLYTVAFVQHVESKRIYQAAVQEIDIQANTIFQLGVEEDLGTVRQLVYPNPSSGRIQVDFGSFQPAGLIWQVIDDVGQMLRNGRMRRSVRVMQLNIEDLPEGSYTLLLQPADGGQVIARRIVIQDD